LVALEVKLRDGDFKFIEKLLYDQKTHDAQIALLQAEIEEMLPAYSSSVVKFNHNDGMKEDSQPEEWAIIRCESVRAKEIHSEIKRRRRHKEAISAAMECMTEEESQLIFLRYAQEQSHNHCAKALHLWDRKEKNPSRTYWRLRRKVLEKVARFVLF